MTIPDWKPFPETAPPDDKVREYLVTSRNKTVTIAKFPTRHWMNGRLQYQDNNFTEIRSEMLEVTAWTELPTPFQTEHLKMSEQWNRYPDTEPDKSGDYLKLDNHNC